MALKFDISIARDIAKIFPKDDNIEIYVSDDGKVFVFNNFRNHKVITEFKGNGIVKIYPENRKSSKFVTYNINWSISDPTEGYKISLKQLFS